MKKMVRRYNGVSSHNCSKIMFYQVSEWQSPVPKGVEIEEQILSYGFV